MRRFSMESPFIILFSSLFMGDGDNLSTDFFGRREYVKLN